MNINKNMCESPKADECKIKNLNSVKGVDQLIDLVNVTKERQFVCTFDDCNKSYTSLSHLKRHEDTHGNGYRCTEENCQQYFKTKSTLKKHVDNIHLKKKHKIYKCTICDQEFNKHNWLAKHQFKHTGIKPYLCPEEGCEKRFLVPSKLKRHLKIHQGYTCSKENCGQKFSKWTLYVQHIKTSHPKVHKCDYCEKIFTTTSNLKAHIEVHDLDREVYLCTKPNCSRFYFLKRNLTHHLKSYHEKRPFVCTEEYCYKAFKSKEDLDAHTPTHDPNKRIRKKKKSNPKPSFAERLAGCVPRKNVKHKTEDDVASEKSLVNSKEKVQAICDTTTAEGNHQDVSDLKSTDDKLSTCGTDSIQTVLNIQETMLERNSYQTESTICISA